MSRGGGDVFVLYFYQGELGESLGTPNAFAVRLRCRCYT